jgi:hypothetical protein
MSTGIGNKRLYETLCKVLDALRNEAPASDTNYRPAPGDAQGLIHARSRALLHLFLKARFGLVEFADREKFITDGPLDGGIDAFYIDQRNKSIYILQSKFRATAENFVANNLSTSDLLHMDVRRILTGEKKHENGQPYNDRITKGLQRAVQRLTDAASYTTRVVLLGNSKRFSPSELRRLIEGYSPDQFPHDRAYRDLLFPVIAGTYYTDPTLTIEIKLANLAKGDPHLDYDVKIGSLKSNIKLLFVPTREIGRIMYTYKNSILRFNPRSFLELMSNPVNKDIEASIRDVTSNEFAMFNNGITMISDRTNVSSDTGRQGTAQVVIQNPQLVNGAQTAYTLGRIYEKCASNDDFRVFKGKEVLLKIITFVGSQRGSAEKARLELVGEISKASNSQTKVEESDRRSNDPIQIKLQQELFEGYGLYYERKRGEFSDGLHYSYLTPKQIIRREKLVRVSLACAYRANQARSSVTKFFKQGAITSVLSTAEAGRYAFGYEVLDLLETTKKSKPKTKGDRYHMKVFGRALRYGQYAVVAVCVNVGLPAKKTEQESVEAVLGQWPDFESWVERQPNNSKYKSGTSFDYVNYYKGSTIESDLQAYKFAL